MVKSVADQLGNTPAICRRCYIHPAVVEGFRDVTRYDRWRTLATRKRKISGLTWEESTLLRFLR